MKKKKEAYTVQLDPEFVAKLDILADKLGLSRSQLMGNLLENSYEEAVILDKLGVLTAARALRDLMEKYVYNRDKNGQKPIR